MTILDDYQHVAFGSADWTEVERRFRVEAIANHVDGDALVEQLRDSEVVVAMRERTTFPAELFERLPALRLLVTTGMKNASIDLAAAARHGVVVSGTGGAGNGVSELTIGMIIALTRHFVEEDASVRSGGWQHTIGPGLAGKTLGIVGFGRLGVQVAHLAQAFGMTTIAWSRSLTAERAAEHGATAVTKDELFRTSDIVTIHVPLTSDSRGLVTAREFALMNPGGYLINTSRGAIVDETALLDALSTRHIAGAALDVYDVEPLPAEHPLRSAPHTLLLPHIGYVTKEAYAAFYRDAVDGILSWDDGAPVRVLG